MAKAEDIPFKSPINFKINGSKLVKRIEQCKKGEVKEKEKGLVSEVSFIFLRLIYFFAILTT